LIPSFSSQYKRKRARERERERERESEEGEPLHWFRDKLGSISLLYFFARLIIYTLERACSSRTASLLCNGIVILFCGMRLARTGVRNSGFARITKNLLLQSQSLLTEHVQINHLSGMSEAILLLQPSRGSRVRTKRRKESKRAQVSFLLRHLPASIDLRKNAQDTQ